MWYAFRIHKIIAGIFIGLVVLGASAYILFSKSQENDEGEETIVYESDAESADDCTSRETFDAKQKVCRFECASEEECAKIEAEINTELDALGEEYVESAKNFSEREQGDAPNATVATYRVNTDESISLLTGAAKTVHTEAWDIFSKISPNPFTERFVEAYEAVQNEQDDTLAYVHDDDGNGRFTLGINFGTYGKEGKRGDLLTLMHEFTHVLTLNNTQVGEQKAGGCEWYDTGNGCALPTSYLTAFVQNFWPKADIAQAQKQENSGLYAKKESSFVTEYAAMSPEEDIAESFALFILEKKPVAESTIAQKKVSFFYGYPELISLRNDTRKAIGGVVLERKRRNR